MRSARGKPTGRRSGWGWVKSAVPGTDLVEWRCTLGGPQVGRIALVLLVSSLAALAVVAERGRASLYAPEDPRFIVPVGDDGKPRPLPLDDFRNAMAVLMNAQDNRQDARKEGDRKAFLDRIEAAKGKKLSPPQTAALAADLLRAARADEALNRLAPRLRDRNPDYFVYTTYANIRAAAGDWAEALRYHSAAQLDSELPSGVPGLSKAQRDWWEKLDRDYVPHYYRLRLKESAERKEKSRADRETGRDRGGLSALPSPGPRQPASATGPLRQRGRRVPAGRARRRRARQAPIGCNPDRPATSPVVPHREPVVLAAGRTLRGRGGLRGVVEVVPVDLLGPGLRQPQSVHGPSPGR